MKKLTPIFIITILFGCTDNQIEYIEATDDTCKKSFYSKIENREVKMDLATKCNNRGTFKKTNEPAPSLF